MIKKYFKKFKKLVNLIARRRINKKDAERLENKDMTVIASSCIGCITLHDLGCKFNSPFVNLYIAAEGFVKLLKDFDHYMNSEFTFIETKESYPVALLDDVEIHFMHYRDAEHVTTEWNRRKERIDLSNCFVIFTDRDGCTKEILQEFDNLPYENKVVFTNKEYPDIKSSYYIKGFENEESVGRLYEFTGWNGKRHYDAFDFVSWFNKGKK